MALTTFSRSADGVRGVRSGLGWSLLIAVVMVGLTGCGGGSKSAAPTTSTTASSSSSSPASASSSSTTASVIPASTSPTPSTPTQALTFCSPSQLQASFLGHNGGGGTGFYGFEVTNIGTRSCPIGGFFGVSVYDQAGQLLIATDSRTVDVNPEVPAAVPTVVLATGQTASALLEGETGPAAGAPACPAYTAYEITPPSDSQSVRLPSDYSLCSIKIHPVVSGDSGGASAG